jgi:hypothetical protein
MEHSSMNERIKELEAQCWEPKQYGPPWFNSQKFAELIVQECARVLWNIDNGELHDEYVESLKKHFGIE